MERGIRFQPAKQFLVFCLLFLPASAEVRYVLPEEMPIGSAIGNVARDLGLPARELGDRRARVIAADGGGRLCELDSATGDLLISRRVDREELCGQASVCTVHHQLLLQDPLRAFGLILDVTDINDNAPVFAAEEIRLDLAESTVLGSRFPLESARDPDLGTNSVREYKLSPNQHFSLETSTQINGKAYPELVLKKALDREEQAEHVLKIDGIDRGSPARTGTATVRVRVLDANDNAPVFSQRVYRASVPENSPAGTLIARLDATDSDDGSYGEVTYSFSHLTDETRGVFHIDPQMGEVRVAGVIDYERARTHEVDVQAKDGGGQASHCKLVVDVVDVNDNRPVIEIKSASAKVPEDAQTGTMVALVNVYDTDGGDVACSVSDDVPFQIVSEVKNYYMLVTAQPLDRELRSEYNVTITAADSGSPPLESVKVLTVAIDDINDNPPTFAQREYTADVPENLPAGTSVTRVAAQDADAASNAKLTYRISKETDWEVSSFLTIDEDTGDIFTSRVLDHEESVYFRIKVEARDGGEPPFTAACTVNVFVKDQNDNAPLVLHPAPGSASEDMVPLEAPGGYLVTKVVAVDADSGHNAWLSYRIVKETQPYLFSVGLHTGEIRTLRTFGESDQAKQTLVIAVTDDGAEARSATATVSIAVGAGLPVLQELFQLVEESRDDDNLRLYLSVALLAVSTLLILLIVGVFYFKLCRRSYVYRSTATSLPVFPSPYYPPSFGDFSRYGTLLKDDRLDPFMTTGSWRGDFRFGSNTDTDTLKKRSAAYQKNTLRRTSAERPAFKARAAPSHPCYVIT
ncbi:protocadherin gamma-A10-like [Stigmatopora argus]